MTSLNLELLSLSPNTPETKAKLSWDIRRNPDDFLTGSLPSLTVNLSDTTKATLETDAEGSFNIIAYCDQSGSGGWQSGKILAVLNMVLARVTMTANAVTPSSANFSTSTSGGMQNISSGTIANPCVSFSADLLLEGGGNDCKMGLSNVALGWIGNGRGDSFVVQYPAGHTGSENITPEIFPILDSNRSSPGSGGSTAFRTTSSSAAMTPPPKGEKYKVTALDAPQVVFLNGYPTAADHASSTDGNNDFTDYLSAYSSDWDKEYVVFGKAEWSAKFKYKYAGGWADAGSSCTGPAALNTSGCPQPSTTSGAVTVGPATFPNSAHMVYL